MAPPSEARRDRRYSPGCAPQTLRSVTAGLVRAPPGCSSNLKQPERRGGGASPAGNREHASGHETRRGETSQVTASAISSGMPTRATASWLPSARARRPESKSGLVMSVPTDPGDTASPDPLRSDLRPEALGGALIAPLDAVQPQGRSVRRVSRRSTTGRRSRRPGPPCRVESRSTAPCRRGSSNHVDRESGVSAAASWSSTRASCLRRLHRRRAQRAVRAPSSLLE